MQTIKMRRLDDRDIEEMAAGNAAFDTAALKSAARKSLKIKKSKDLGGYGVIDCHGMTEEAAFEEIERQLGSVHELTVITGKSGEIKRLFHISITEGYLKNRIKSWKLENPGCYKIRVRRP